MRIQVTTLLFLIMVLCSCGNSSSSSSSATATVAEVLAQYNSFMTCIGQTPNDGSPSQQQEMAKDCTQNDLSQLFNWFHCVAQVCTTDKVVPPNKKYDTCRPLKPVLTSACTAQFAGTP